MANYFVYLRKEKTMIEHHNDSLNNNLDELNNNLNELNNILNELNMENFKDGNLF